MNDGSVSLQSAAEVKRPRLALNPNAKISTKLRQTYLDKYIDEHMKMGIPPEDAYQKVWAVILMPCVTVME